jgi:hypothetical protein
MEVEGFDFLAALALDMRPRTGRKQDAKPECLEMRDLNRFVHAVFPVLINATP